MTESQTGMPEAALPPEVAAEVTPAPPPAGLSVHILAIFLALLGGGLGIGGALVQETRASGINPLGIILAAPVIEEALKPVGIYILLICCPSVISGRLHAGLLGALAGLSFGIIESLVYVYVYYPEGSDDFVLWRFTVTPALHLVCSFIVGLGLSRGIIDWANGKSKMPKSTRNFYLLAVLIHATYNTTAMALAISGVWSLE